MQLDKNYAFGYDDVFFYPRMSRIRSRKEVDISTKVAGLELGGPIVSANMKAVTGSEMCDVMALAGGLGILHRFCTVEENVNMFENALFAANFQKGVSIGLGDSEMERAEALVAAGATILCIDVAHGAQHAVVDQTILLKKKFPYCFLIVGNFATKSSIDEFKSEVGRYKPECYKVGISNGAACTTRMQTGVGVPQFSSVMDCASGGDAIIADGGIKHAGDVAKALAAGATAVMVGRLLAGTDEAPSKIVKVNGTKFKEYYGSASVKSYTENGKTAAWRAAEGVSYNIPYVGSAKQVIEELHGGLRSAMSYNDAASLKEFSDKARFGVQTRSGLVEGTSHGMGTQNGLSN